MLDASSLAKLRHVVRALDAANTHGSSLREVVALTRELQLDTGLTVDFEATRDLGQPMVVLRPLPNVTLPGLTRREQDVAALVAAGHSNKQIAQRLGLTVGTVKHYVHQILDKTGLSGRVAIAQATAAGAAAPAIFR